MATVEFFFDCSSPWTYLAFERVQALADLPEIAFTWKPFLVGGVFNSVNPSVYENRAKPVPAKQRYYAKDLQDWANYAGLTIGAPPVFPVNSVKVMRGAFLAIEEDCLPAYARLAFQSYWRDLRDISLDDEVTRIAVGAGLDIDEFWARIKSQAYKDKLRANTEELIARGGFGSPTIFVDGDDMYFGNDRLPLIERKLLA